MIKNRYNILIICVLIFIFLIILIYTYRYLVLSNNNNQIYILNQIYNEVCSDDENITLKPSALENFITGKKFNSEVFSFENNLNGKDMVISIKYNKREKLLTVIKENEDGTYFYSQMYKISIGFNKLKFEKYGNYTENIVKK